MSPRSDALVALALVGICAAAWLWLIPAFAGGHGEQTVMPRIAVGLIGALSLLLLAASLIRARGGAAGASGNEEIDPFLEMDSHGEPGRLFVVMAIWCVALVLAPFFGLHLGGALAACLTFLAVGIRGPVTIAVWSLLPVALLHVIFQYGFGLRLPRGMILPLITG